MWMIALWIGSVGKWCWLMGLAKLLGFHSLTIFVIRFETIGSSLLRALWFLNQVLNQNGHFFYSSWQMNVCSSITFSWIANTSQYSLLGYLNERNAFRNMSNWELENLNFVLSVPRKNLKKFILALQTILV